MKRRLIGAAVVVCLAQVVAAEPACSDDAVMLRGDWGSVRFSVELADTPREQARGLMNRESMPASSGMLFVYDEPGPAYFWMRNTLIPLDMIFSDAQGVVTHVHHEAVPLDETSIFGGDAVLTVLEINGGLARKLGIDVGTELRHPAFDANDAAWPC